MSRAGNLPDVTSDPQRNLPGLPHTGPGSSGAL